MAPGAIDLYARESVNGVPPDENQTCLLDTLSNSIVLYQILPYLPISAQLDLAATSQSFRQLLHHTPGVFRHLDLTKVNRAQFDIGGIDHGGEVWRNVQLDENLTEDDFYSGPLRGIFHNIRRRDMLRDVQTLVLDGLSVTAELCNDILVDPSFSVRILSIRETKNLNERKLMQSLKYACRATRPDGTPRLRGLYVFGNRDAQMLTLSDEPAKAAPASAGNVGMNWNHKSQHALSESILGGGDDWYHKKGKIISRPVKEGWAETLLDCQEVISMDAVLCRGPRHLNSPAYGKVRISPNNSSERWAVATIALGGCAGCGSAPEGLTVHGEAAISELPLLAPVPLHSSNIRVATCPSSTASSGKPTFVARCLECVRERYCFSCQMWWCEACYQVPTHEDIMASQHVHIVDDTGGLQDHEVGIDRPKPKVLEKKITKSCWECESNCQSCIADTQRVCRACCGGYCIIHNEGSTHTLCDWCSSRRRPVRELY